MLRVTWGRVAALALLLVGLIGGLPVAAQTDSAPAGELVFDPTTVIGAIDPHVYGANYGPWALVSIDMQPVAAESGVTHFRFPGGRWGDENTVTRQQLDLFMLQANAWGADVSISVRLEGGTPEQAADLVRYVNVEQGYNVRHWSIGNEPDLFREYTVERFNAEWREFALAMEAVDPSILLIGPEVSQFPPTVDTTEYLAVRRDWVREFLLANGDLVDLVSVHRYPFPRGNNLPATTAADLYADAPEWDGLVAQLRELVQETTGRDLPLAITEVNSHWNHVIGGEGTPDSQYHAIWWADVLGRLIRGRVSLVNYFALSTFGSLGGYGLLDRYAPRPTFYVYELYEQFGDQLVASDSTHPDVTITAAIREDGLVTVMIVNRGFETLRLPLRTRLGSGQPIPAEIWRLDAEHPAVQIGTAADTVWQSGEPIELPPASVTLYVLALGG